MQVISINTDALIPYDQNAKKHPQEQIDLIVNSIEQFGFRTPIVIDENFVIIQGHGRRLASLQMDLKTVPCIIADDLSAEHVKMLRLADNKVAESDWNIGLLNSELEDLEDQFNVEDFGFFTIEDMDLDEEPPSESSSDPKIIVCPECGHEFEEGED